MTLTYYIVLNMERQTDTVLDSIYMSKYNPTKSYKIDMKAKM
jgi:hypothetical protein